MWDKLSMAEKARIIALGVQSGITDLNNIRQGYNSFANEDIKNYNKFDDGGSKSNKVNYYNPITGQNYGDTMPEGMSIVRRFEDLTPQAQDEYMANRPTQLDDLVVYPRSGKGAKSTNMGSYYDTMNTLTEQNRKHAEEVAMQDALVRETSAFEKPLNFLSPGQYFGAAVDYFQGESPFWEGVYNGNSGWVPDSFAEKYPRISTLANAGLDMAFDFVPVLGKNTIMKGINATRQGYTTARDLLWLGKTYNNVGTGLKNPWVRKEFWDLAKNPSLSRDFIEMYTRNNRAGLNLNQIKEAMPQLQQLQREFGITPKAEFNDFTPLTEQIGEIRSGLQDARSLANRYTEGLEFLKGKNQVLYDIARESPQYLDQIVNDFRAGRITNLEEYVKSLIEQANTFVRRMDLKPGTDLVKAFSEIRGHSMGADDFAMDVGNPNVVYHPIWSRGYGNRAALYTPKEVSLQGPVETWWSQRMPKFQDQSISIDTNGMHTSREGIFNSHSSTSLYNVNRYLEQQGVPQSYGRTSSHMIFTSPNEGASILDQFNITPYGTIPNLRFTLGYQNGGKLRKKSKNVSRQLGENPFIIYPHTPFTEYGLPSLTLMRKQQNSASSKK